MPDDTRSEGIKQEAIQQTPETEPIHPPTLPDNPPAPPAKTVPENNVDAAVHAIEDRVKRAEWLMIGLTAGIVLLTLGLVIVGILQWRVMSGQLGEMKSGGDDTHALALAAIGQEQQIENMASAASAQAVAAIGQLDELEALAKATEETSRLTAESNKNATEALHITEAADIVLDRIGCNTVGATNPQPLGLNTTVSIAFLNRGRTSASAATSYFYMGYYGRQILPVREIPSISTIGPGQPLDSASLRVGASTSEDDLRLVNSGTLALHIFGWVVYKDRFRLSHLLIFDATYVPMSTC